jgi:hypothetical protein
MFVYCRFFPCTKIIELMQTIRPLEPNGTHEVSKVRRPSDTVESRASPRLEVKGYFLKNDWRCQPAAHMGNRSDRF